MALVGAAWVAVHLLVAGGNPQGAVSCCLSSRLARRPQTWPVLRPVWRQATRLAAHGILRPLKTFGGQKVVASTCLCVSCLYLSRAHGVVVSHPLRMRKALGSIPSVSIPYNFWNLVVWLHICLVAWPFSPNSCIDRSSARCSCCLATFYQALPQAQLPSLKKTTLGSPLHHCGSQKHDTSSAASAASA